MNTNIENLKRNSFENALDIQITYRKEYEKCW